MIVVSLVFNVVTYEFSLRDKQSRHDTIRWSVNRPSGFNSLTLVRGKRLLHVFYLKLFTDLHN